MAKFVQRKTKGGSIILTSKKLFTSIGDRPRGGGSSPTPTERQLNQSLIPVLRNQEVSQVKAIQTEVARRSGARSIRFGDGDLRIITNQSKNSSGSVNALRGLSPLQRARLRAESGSRKIVDATKRRIRNIDERVFNKRVSQFIRREDTKTFKAINFVSLGSLKDSKLNKEQEKLNTRIKNFNTNFGGKELSESEFNKAEAESNKINNEVTS